MNRPFLKRPPSRAIFSGQAGTDQFPIIASKDVFVGVGGMRPTNAAPLAQLLGRRRDQLARLIS